LTLGATASILYYMPHPATTGTMCCCCRLVCG